MEASSEEENHITTELLYLVPSHQPSKKAIHAYHSLKDYIDVDVAPTVSFWAQIHQSFYQMERDRKKAE